MFIPVGAGGTETVEVGRDPDDPEVPDDPVDPEADVVVVEESSLSAAMTPGWTRAFAEPTSLRNQA
jgi:hypothetical protein